MANEYQKIFMVVYNVTIEDLAYFAGFFDGEGSVKAAVYRRQTQAGINIGNTNRAILDWIKQKFGGRIYKGSHEVKHKIWHWQYTGKKILPLLRAIEPLLKIKVGEVRLAIEMLEYIHAGGGNIPEPQYYFEWLEGKAQEIKFLKSSYKISVN